MKRADDVDILRYARIEKRVCVTLDSDFHSLIAVSGEAQPSVIRIPKEGLNAEAIVELLWRIWPGIEGSLDGGAMVTVTDHSDHVRRLPVVRS
jgi:predicted nuclease of predicted toxin-antitoxin system